MSLLKQIDSVQKKFETELSSAIDDSSKLQSLYNKYLSRKGIISGLFSKLSEVDNKEKPTVGKKLNILRNSVPAFIKDDEDLKSQVSKVSEADIKDGGEGAIYIFLKNDKKFIG